MDETPIRLAMEILEAIYEYQVRYLVWLGMDDN